MEVRINSKFKNQSGTLPEMVGFCFMHIFMFELNSKEAEVLRSQFVTLEGGRGKFSKYQPYAFTEQGVAMLSSVLPFSSHKPPVILKVIFFRYSFFEL